jgi:ketosteroid isomerase-like protein
VEQDQKYAVALINSSEMCDRIQKLDTKMKKAALIVLSSAFCFLLGAQHKTSTVNNSEEAAVKNVVENFLTAAGNYDIDAMPALFAENANIGGVSMKSGEWSTYTMTIQEFMDVLRADSDPDKYTEPVSKYTVHITEGRLAFVKADATLYVSGVARTYNYDYFTLIKQDGTWRILNGSYVAVPVGMNQR